MSFVFEDIVSTSYSYGVISDKELNYFLPYNNQDNKMILNHSKVFKKFLYYYMSLSSRVSDECLFSTGGNIIFLKRF